MTHFGRRLGRIGLAASLLAFAALSAGPSRAQGNITIPQWMRDSLTVQNPYLLIWEYFTGNQVTRFNIWNQGGDPLNPNDDFFLVYTQDTNGNITYVSPWGSRLWSHINPINTDAEPHTNIATFRFDLPAGSTGGGTGGGGTTPAGFQDALFPGGTGGGGGGSFSAIFAPPVFPLFKDQGTAAPYRFVINNLDTMEVNQKLTFARDLVRIEYIVRNRGNLTGSGVSGGSHQVGLKLVLDPFVDLGLTRTDFLNPEVTRSVFLPQTRTRVFYETDYGQLTPHIGTLVRPRNPVIPDEVLAFDDDEGPNPNYIAKLILRGNGATPPTRFAIVNTLNIFPANVAWDYPTDFGQELRISDIGFVMYWDPVRLNVGQSTSFVVYAGLGSATHGMSNAYLESQRRQISTRPTDETRDQTEGYIAAVQAPFALPLNSGNADLDAAGNPASARVDAFAQNQYYIASLPNQFAFIDLPDGLELTDTTTQARKLEMGSVPAIGTGLDEGHGFWTVKPNGEDAGLLKVSVTFSNDFQDSVRVVREINVPQGRLYQLTGDYKMVTFPFNYDQLQSDPAVVLGLPAGSFKIVRFNPEINDYERVTQIKPGEAYWVRLTTIGANEKRPVRLNNANPVKLGTSDTFSIQLKTGWNQIGNPNPYVIRVRDLRIVTNGGQVFDYDQAVQAKYIRPALYDYDRKLNGGSYRRLGPDDLLQPGHGIWIYSNGPRRLLVRGPQGPKISITP